jgi:hypothetical protein
MPQDERVDQIVSTLTALKAGPYSSLLELAYAFSVGTDLAGNIEQKLMQGELVGAELDMLRKLILEQVFFPAIKNLKEDYFDLGKLSGKQREEHMLVLGTAHSIRTFGGDIYGVEDVLHLDPTKDYQFDKSRLMTSEEFIRYLAAA